MKRFTLALLALLALTINSWAVATVKTALSATVWTDLGAGPALVAANGAVVFAIADTTPTIPVGQGFILNTNQCLNTTSHVWAMSSNAFAAWAFVAPVAGC